MYDEVEIEDMEWNDELTAFTYACPCGDVFQITKVGAPRACASDRLLCVASWRRCWENGACVAAKQA